MDQNTAAIRALQEYVKLEKPGYAFMIEAPWGAGKTHLIKQEFKKCIDDDCARYVALNGISDQTSFRRALLTVVSGAKLIDAVETFANTVGKISKIGNVGGLIRDVIEDRLIEDLPDLLIFDDVERCQLSPSELLGLLNEFVEHREKNVVLCGYTERDEASKAEKKFDDFLSQKEKVVGRTVRIVADSRKVVPEFISAMPDGHGKSWLKSNDALVLEVFGETSHSNLRVLRQSLHDCGRVIDGLDEELRGSKAAMIRFVRTYLVLSMALASGEILPSHLSVRSDYQCVMPPEKGKDPHPLNKTFAQHPRAEIFSGNSASILPLDLGISLIGIGHEECEKINEALRATGQFGGDRELPLWQRFAEWRRTSTTELEKFYEEAKSYIFQSEDIEAGPYLLVAHDYIAIAKYGFENELEATEQIEKRIKALAEKEKIPAAAYGNDFGWSKEDGTFMFGGYQFAPDQRFQQIIECMKKAQIAAFENSQNGEPERLISLLQNDLEAFAQEFLPNNKQGSYFGTEILHRFDANSFSKEIFRYVDLGKSVAIGTLLKALADRHDVKDMPKETGWIKEVKVQLEALVKEAEGLKKAQMVSFVEFYWKFPTTPEKVEC